MLRLWQPGGASLPACVPARLPLPRGPPTLTTRLGLEALNAPSGSRPEVSLQVYVTLLPAGAARGQGEGRQGDCEEQAQVRGPCSSETA